jgi:serine/threonine protein kinase/tetratricopeptide (TPR) repeat protein
VISGSGPALAEVLSAFDEIAVLDGASQQARLTAIGASDPKLREAVEALMAADSRADTILTRVEAVLGEPPLESDPLHVVGRTVSSFRVLEPLAHGGMGVIYRAEDTRLGRLVALKFPLLPRFDRAARERFRHEARVAAALDHPNLCPVYETGETPEGDLFYSMPLYEGETLKARLARQGPLSLVEALRIAVQLARGLGAAHGAGIVHRDLKPGNVMLLPDEAVKILDFGLAKASDLSLTGSRGRFGTISYMAPEQVLGHKVDVRADLWALGVVLQEMVTGRRPFDGGHEIGIAHAILHDETPRASTLRDDIPAELDALLHTLLRKDPAQRPRSAEDVAAALAAVPLDRRAGWRRRLRHTRSPAWRLSMLSLATLGVLGGGAALARRAATGPPLPVSLAVLPFERVGDSAETHYLAAGLGDAIISDLARLQDVVAPSAVTVSVYRDHPKAVKAIAAELQVGAVLRGSVRRSGGRVWVDARLLDREEGELWVRRYDRPLSQLASVERDIVRSSLAALQVRPAASERALLDRPPTAQGRAFDLYLRGRAVELAGTSRELGPGIPTENIRLAQSFYTQARDADPAFAVARARLALMHTLSAAIYDTSRARREQARLEAEAALRLQPDLSEAHEALAAYWDLSGDLDKGIEQLNLAIRGFPNSGHLRMLLGSMLARAGRLDDAVAEFDQAMRLEPGSPKAAFAAALFHLRLRRDEHAMRAFDRALALAPDYHMVKVIKGHTYLRWKGTPDTLAAAMQTVPDDWDPEGMATWARYTALWAQRRYTDALAMLDRSRTQLSRDGLVYQPMPLMRARLYDSMGERARARSSYVRARAVLEDSVAARPDEAGIRIALGLAYAGLGRTADAVREARKAMELVPLTSNTPAATAFMGGAVEVFARAGEADAAFELLELLFSMPAGREVTRAFLRVWPGFDPLRRDPRLEELLVRYDAAG